MQVQNEKVFDSIFMILFINLIAYQAGNWVKYWARKT